MQARTCRRPQAVIAALCMVKIAGADEPLHYGKHIKRIGQHKDCWCAMVGFEFGEWTPLEYPSDGRVAVASWTTAHYERDESGEVVSNVGLHVCNPHLVNFMQEKGIFCLCPIGPVGHIGIQECWRGYKGPMGRRSGECMGGRKFGNVCVQAYGRPVSFFFGSEIAAS